MRDRELSAGEIAASFAVSRPAISQHLRVLREANLVSERRDGTRRYYRAQPQTIAEVGRFLERFWDDGLDRLRDVAETAERNQRMDATVDRPIADPAPIHDPEATQGNRPTEPKESS